MEERMNELRDKETGRSLGSITEDQLQFLVDQLEEESGLDTDYYLNTATLDMFQQSGIDPQLLDILRRGLGDREGMEIELVRTGE
jgi:processive 1,2-diacylglycerol beta-glucosyltransferase